MSRVSLPLPNELLDQILSDLVVNNLHLTLLCHAPPCAPWNALVVLPHVCRTFRATAIRIYAGLFALRLGKCGDWLLERAHHATRRIPRLPIPGASDDESAALLDSIIDGEYDNPPGLLRVYASVARSSFVCHGALQRGFEAFQLSPRTFACLTTLIQDAIYGCATVRPARLAERASQLVVTQCAVHVLTFIFWVSRSSIEHAVSLIERSSVEVLSSSLDALEIYEPQIIDSIPAYIISQHCPTNRIITPSVLQDSGVIPVLEKLAARDDDDPYGLITHAQKVLQAWQPLLQDGAGDSVAS